MELNKLAQELNSALAGTTAGNLLSNLGRRMYFPKGIIAQSAEAKKAAAARPDGGANATIGQAFSHGKPLMLSSIKDNLASLDPAKAVVYAPTAGLESARKAWKEGLVEKNPSLKGKTFSLPIVAPGITAGIANTADLFLDQGQTILCSSPCWDNYGLIFQDRRSALVREVPYFGTGKGMELAALEAALNEEAKKRQVRLILNFPNNPSGYTPTKEEAGRIVAMLKKLAQAGTELLVIIDDAYFGLFYEDGLFKESLFAELADCDEKLVAVKVDGPTKEDYAWGLRSAFITFAWKGMTEAAQDALTKKYMGLIRSSVSCANTPAQLLLLKTTADPRSKTEKKEHYDELKARYEKVKAFTQSHKCAKLSPLPFNSGYFMSFRCSGGLNAEDLRKKLLDQYGIGVIALYGQDGAQYIRVAFSSLEADKIEKVLDTIFKTA